MSAESRRIKRISAHAGPVPGTGTVREETVAKLIDVTTCIGCRACEIACQEWNDLPFADTVFQNDHQTMPDTSWNLWTLIKMNEVEHEDGTLQWLLRKQGWSIAPIQDAWRPSARGHRPIRKRYR